MNVFDSLWMEGDSVFIHEAMRIQITFLLLAYCFSGARIGAFLHNGKAEVKGEDGQIDRLVFEGLTWKVRRYYYRRDAASEELTASQDVHIYLFPLHDGTTEIIVKLVQRWTKNNKDPENSVYALVILTALDPRLTPEQARGSSLRTRQTEIRHNRVPAGPCL
jgi:hypothetical protein